MYGFSLHTIVYWGIEACITGLMAVVLAVGVCRKWRASAFVFPAGQLLIRVAALVFQPSEYGYELTFDRVALMLALCVVSVLMAFYSGFGYATAVGSMWMIGMTFSENWENVGTYFSFGGELTFLGLEVIFSWITYALLFIAGLQYVRKIHHQPFRSC